MKNLIIFLLILTLSLNLVSAYPKIEPYVNDFANILSDQEELQLNQIADNIEKNTTYEIAIVTILNTEGQDRIEFANRIGDENGVGKKDADNGIVVLWSLDNEKGGAIATGRGSESILNDAKVGRIGREARPYFDKGSYYEGFNFILMEINGEIVAHNSNPIISNNENQEFTLGATFYVIPIFIFIFILIKLVHQLNKDDTEYYNDESYTYKEPKRAYRYKKVKGKRKRYYLYGAAATSLLSSRSSSSNSNSSSRSSTSSFSSGSHSFGGFGAGSFGGGGGRF